MDLTQQSDQSCLTSLFGFHDLSRIPYLSSLPPTKPPTRPPKTPRRSRFAIIGAGISGIAAAAHITNLGFACHIFEAGGEDQLGGIWSRVNSTSGLQVHSSCYRFHPSVRWRSEYPLRDDILNQTRRLWKENHLLEKTSFNFKVTRVYREGDGWVINDRSYGNFQGVVVAVGTCGSLQIPNFPGMDHFSGDVLDASRLDGKEMKDKEVAIIGGGASAVEAVEYATANNAAKINVLARASRSMVADRETEFADFIQSEQWIIPRSWIFGMLLAFRHSSKEMLLGRLLEYVLRTYFYRGIRHMAPPKKTRYRLNSSTPIINSRIMNIIRSGQARWLRGDVKAFAEDGVVFNNCAPGVEPGISGHETKEKAEVCILATGYSRPSLHFLPQEYLDDPYGPPNWFLQTFPTNDPTMCALNSTWVRGHGSVGGFHIAIYTRLLVVFVVDPRTRLEPREMKNWVDRINSTNGCPEQTNLCFVTTLQLLFWFCMVICSHPKMWRWFLFIFFGIGEAV